PVAGRVCTDSSGDEGMRKASTALLEQGIETPSPAPDLIPAETSIENLHWHWYSKRGHFTLARQVVDLHFRIHPQPPILLRSLHQFCHDGILSYVLALFFQTLRLSSDRNTCPNDSFSHTGPEVCSSLLIRWAVAPLKHCRVSTMGKGHTFASRSGLSSR